MSAGTVLVHDIVQSSPFVRTAPEVSTHWPRELDTTGHNTGQTQRPVGEWDMK